MKTYIGSLFLVALCAAHACAQDEDLGYEELYDEPYSVKRLFVGFQPFYGDLFLTNITGGYGLEVKYLHPEKFDVTFQLRKSYSRRFFDMAREAAVRNNSLDNNPEIFNYFELGGTYYLSDKEIPAATRMIKRKVADKGPKLSASVPERVSVPARVRQIIGLRGGGIVWNTTTNIGRALRAQNLTHQDFKNAQGAGLPDTFTDQNGVAQPLILYSNLYVGQVYLGGSLTRIRNVAYSFTGFDSVVDDGIVTYFADLFYAPFVRVDDLVYEGQGYSVAPLNIRSLGLRLGVEGRFNRTWGWGYGAEAGFRPGLEGRTFFILSKISVPMYGSRLRKKGR